jgi:integrase
MHKPDLVSATLVSLFAYTGARPEDLLALEVRHIGRATLLIEQKNVDGEILVGQKTERPPRSIDLLAPVRQDLASYLLATGRRATKGAPVPAA